MHQIIITLTFMITLVLSGCAPVSFTFIPPCDSPIDCLKKTEPTAQACEVLGINDRRFTLIENIYWKPIQATIKVDRVESVNGQTRQTTTETRQIYFGNRKSKGFGCVVSLGSPQPDGSQSTISTTVTIIDACYPNANHAFEPNQVCDEDDIIEPDSAGRIELTYVDCESECSTPNGRCTQLGSFNFVTYPPNPSLYYDRAYRLYNFVTASNPGQIDDVIHPYLDLNTINEDLLWALFQGPIPPQGWCEVQSGTRDEFGFSVGLSTCMGRAVYPGGRELEFYFPSNIRAQQQITKTVINPNDDISTSFAYTFNDRAHSINLFDSASGLMDYVYLLRGSFRTEDQSTAVGEVITQTARGQCQRINLSIELQNE